MNFDTFYEFVKWLFLPAVGLLFMYMRQQFAAHMTYVREKHNELCQATDEHNRSDAEIHREVMAEVGALREQTTAFQIEVAKSYVTSRAMDAALGAMEQGIRRDVTEIKADVKEILQHYLKRIP